MESGQNFVRIKPPKVYTFHGAGDCIFALGFFFFMEWLTRLWRQSAPPPTSRHLTHLELVNLLKLTKENIFLSLFASNIVVSFLHLYSAYSRNSTRKICTRGTVLKKQDSRNITEETVRKNNTKETGHKKTVRNKQYSRNRTRETGQYPFWSCSIDWGAFSSSLVETTSSTNSEVTI